MSEADLLELIFMRDGMVSPLLMQVATVFLAYVACAFFVGHRLNRFFAVAVSVVYSYFVLSSMVALTAIIGQLQLLIGEYIRLFPNGVMFTQDSAPGALLYLFTAGPCLLAWAVSLAFMHAYVRRVNLHDAPP